MHERMKVAGVLAFSGLVAGLMFFFNPVAHSEFFSLGWHVANVFVGVIFLGSLLVVPSLFWRATVDEKSGLCLMPNNYLLRVYSMTSGNKMRLEKLRSGEEPVPLCESVLRALGVLIGLILTVFGMAALVYGSGAIIYDLLTGGIRNYSSPDALALILQFLGIAVVFVVAVLLFVSFVVFLGEKSATAFNFVFGTICLVFLGWIAFMVVGSIKHDPMFIWFWTGIFLAISWIFSVLYLIPELKRRNSSVGALCPEASVCSVGASKKNCS